MQLTHTRQHTELGQSECVCELFLYCSIPAIQYTIHLPRTTQIDEFRRIYIQQHAVHCTWVFVIVNPHQWHQSQHLRYNQPTNGKNNNNNKAAKKKNEKFRSSPCSETYSIKSSALTNSAIGISVCLVFCVQNSHVFACLLHGTQINDTKNRNNSIVI